MKILQKSLLISVFCFFGALFAQDYNPIDAVSSASLKVLRGRAYADHAELDFQFAENIHGDETGDYRRCDLRWGTNTSYTDGDISMNPYEKGTTIIKTIPGLSSNTHYYYWIYLSHKDGTKEVKGEFTTFGGSSVTLSSIAVTPGSASKDVGQTQQYTATGTYSDASTQNITSMVSWTSSSNTRATINSSGLATGVSAGTVTITASLDGKSGTAQLTVNALAATLSSISISPPSSFTTIGGTKQFTATGTYSDASTQDISGSVTWTSSSNSFATINNSGMASGMAAGTVTITAALSGKSATAQLTVNANPVTLSSIAVTPGTASKTVGETQQYTATGTYSDASTQDISGDVTWSSSSNAIATVSASGLATGVASGSVTLTAQLDGKSSTAGFTVTAAVVSLSSISISPSTSTINKGESVQFTATGTYSDASTANISASVVWASSDGLVASVNGGLASGISGGSVTVTAALSGKSATAALTVTDIVTLTSITITPGSVTVTMGFTQEFTAEGTFSDGSKRDVTSELIWQVLDPTVAQIAGGTLTPLAAGQTQVFASQGSTFQSAVVNVQHAVAVNSIGSHKAPAVFSNAVGRVVRVDPGLSSDKLQLLVISPNGSVIHDAAVSGSEYIWSGFESAGIHCVILRNLSTGKVISRTRLVML